MAGRIGRVVGRLMGLCLLISFIVDFHLTAVRPAYVNWGATAAERTRALPGDGIVANAVRLNDGVAEAELHCLRDLVDGAAAERVVRMRLEQRAPCGSEQGPS